MNNEQIQQVKKFELISFAVLIIVLVLIEVQMFTIAGTSRSAGEGLFNLMLLYAGAIMVHVGLMIRQTSVRIKENGKIGKKGNDGFFKGWFLTWLLPVVALGILIPALSAGIFNDSETTALGATGIFVFLIALAYLFSPLFLTFVILPIEFIARGIIAYKNGDKSKIGLTVAGLALAGLTVFIFVGAAAVEPDLPYPIGSVQAVFALIGIPVGYEVKDQAMLWVARAIALFYVVMFILIKRSGNRHSPKLRK